MADWFGAEEIMERGGAATWLYYHALKGYARVDELPPKDSNLTRVVCISDTHNQHEQLQLPEGDILVHSGDILTESGLRHVKEEKGGVLVAEEAGVALVHGFARWFGSQKHPYKVFVAGNHDKVVEVLGARKVREIFAQYCREGSFAYLEHEYCKLTDSVSVFGSPFGHWGSHNDAFAASKRPGLRWDMIPEGTHLFITHSPPIVPSEGGQKESELVGVVHRAKSLLHVSGHCHWAYGLYKSSKSIPFAVASVCDSKWNRLASLKGERVDRKWDILRGGYNITFLPIVCDLAVAPPKSGGKWIFHPL